jgi:hypothetical protein
MGDATDSVTSTRRVHWSSRRVIVGIEIEQRGCDGVRLNSQPRPFAKSSRSACIVRPMHRQGCRYCSLTSEEVAYNASYCSAELLRGRPRQRRHSTPSLNRILAVRYDTTQHNVPRKHVPQDGRRVRSILLPPLQFTSLTNFQAAFYSVSAAQH